MHNVKRINWTAQLREQKRVQDAAKIKRYVEQTRGVTAARGRGDVSWEALAKTGVVLDLNPELYTVWNYRREVLEARMAAGEAARVAEVLVQELKLFTVGLLQRYPKSYAIWNHRRWVLENLGRVCDAGMVAVVWGKELDTVHGMLARDPRNFHGWHYRRWVLATREGTGSNRSRGLLQQDYDYTTLALNKNFSNFSAWHQRAQLVPEMLRREMLPGFVESETRYLETCMWTDSSDSSYWLYLRWFACDLVPQVADGPGQQALLERLVDMVQQLNAVEVDDTGKESKWCLVALGWLYKEQARRGASHDRELRELAGKLVVLDPMRQGRWRELAEGG